MTKYLISFPSEARVVADDEWGAVEDASHAVIEDAKEDRCRVPLPAGGSPVPLRPSLLTGLLGTLSAMTIAPEVPSEILSDQ